MLYKINNEKNGVFTEKDPAKNGKMLRRNPAKSGKYVDSLYKI